MAAPTTQPLSFELERAALRAIRRVWDDLNGSLFKWQLRPPGFELVDSSSRLGRWLSGVRVIELGRNLLSDYGWGVLVEVLKHEMAHQYVAEVLAQPDETTHGPAFRKVCQERGIDARAQGVPEVAFGSAQDRHLLERVAKLLALAESSNEHEAQAAMSAAQRLMLKYNIEIAAAGASSDYGFRHLGAPTGRVGESQRILAGILADHFFVETIWVPVWRPLEGKRGSVLEICGSERNLELAAYVHAFLNHTAERLFAEYRSGSARRSRAGRRENFVAGVMSGFRDRLERERTKSKAEGLVWVGDAALRTYFRNRHRHIRFTRHACATTTEAYARGREAGAKIILYKGVQGSANGGAPRLLPSAKR